MYSVISSNGPLIERLLSILQENNSFYSQIHPHIRVRGKVKAVFGLYVIQDL